MKKVFRIMTLGAIALLGAVGFSACSSDENVVEDNPTFDGETVRTDFAFNIATPQTKMSAAITQQDGTTFNGMKDMFLFPFASKPAASTTTNGSNYNLGKLGTTEIKSDQSSRVYALSIPVGTNNFLFYGTSDATGTDAEKGIITKGFDETTTNTDDIKYFLVTINEGVLGSDAANLAVYLTSVANAKYNDGTDDYTWASTTTRDDKFNSLASLYTKFTAGLDGTGNEARSGSVESIKRMMLDLYKSAKAINEEADDNTVKGIANAVYTAIITPESGITVTITETTPTDPKTWTSALTGAAEDFPANLGFPMGAAQLKFVSAAFVYNDSPLFSPSITTPAISQTHVDLDKICYPTELIYYCNSPLLASDVYKQKKDYPITTANWDVNPGTGTGIFDSDWKRDATVKSTTRAVAMQNNVNYGVAMLQTDIKLEASNMEDNRENIIGDANQTDIKGNEMVVTGILIGGQPSDIGWKMTHETNTTFANVIYDSQMQHSTVLTKSFADYAENYTLVLDNYTTATDQPDVLFALQIKNGDKDFYGKDNMIPAGNTFYLVGKMSLSDAASSIETNYGKSYRIPYVIEENDVSVLKPRVFVQDHTTIANITISKNALKNAYSTIPDLVSTQVVFGLSVDLTWKKGLTFTPTIQ